MGLHAITFHCLADKCLFFCLADGLPNSNHSQFSIRCMSTNNGTMHRSSCRLVRAKLLIYLSSLGGDEHKLVQSSLPGLRSNFLAHQTFEWKSPIRFPMKKLTSLAWLVAKNQSTEHLLDFHSFDLRTKQDITKNCYPRGLVEGSMSAGGRNSFQALLEPVLTPIGCLHFPYFQRNRAKSHPSGNSWDSSNRYMLCFWKAHKGPTLVNTLAQIKHHSLASLFAFQAFRALMVGWL